MVLYVANGMVYYLMTFFIIIIVTWFAIQWHGLQYVMCCFSISCHYNYTKACHDMVCSMYYTILFSELEATGSVVMQ